MIDDDTPDFSKISDPEMLAWCADDARKWAKAFLYHYVPSKVLDEDLMVTWFANAIETADDHRAKRRAQQA